MKKVGSFVKAAAATGLALATKNLPIPLSMIPGGAKLQAALGSGLTVGGVDLAAAAADPKAALRQKAMMEAQKATGVNVQELGQLAPGAGQTAPGIGAGKRPRAGVTMKAGAPPPPFLRPEVFLKHNQGKHNASAIETIV